MRLKRIYYKYLIILHLFVSAGDLTAQPSIKWGEVSKEEFALQKTSLDPSAGAVCLHDYGRIIYKNKNLLIQRHVRIKIISKKGFTNANITLPFWNEDNLERITQIRAQTINLDDQGKIIYTKVRKRDIFQENTDAHWNVKKFTFPKIQVGSILEYQYTINSDNFYFLEDWYFQKDIPVLRSELRVKIPDVLQYNMIMSGSKLVSKYGDTPTNTWILEDLPPLKTQDFVYQVRDYAEKIRFQLVKYYKIGVNQGISTVQVLDTWETLSQEILSDYRIRTYLNKENNSDELIEGLNLTNLTPEEKIKTIMRFIRENFRWNKNFQLYTDQRYNDFIKNKSGSSSELNLLLLNLLKSAGLKAHPVLTATRKYGKISKIYPLLSQFNHILVYLDINEGYFLDATSGHTMFFLPPFSCLGSHGLILKDEAPEWKIIYPDVKNEIIHTLKTTFQNDRPLIEASTGYSGYFLADLNNLQRKHDHLLTGTLKRSLLSCTDSLSFHPDNQGYHAQMNYRIIPPAFNSSDNSIIYYQPYPFNYFNENPFNDNIRYYPVEMPFTQNFLVESEIIIPEGFHLSELPANTSGSLPDHSAYFTYTFEVKGQSILMKIKLRFRRLIFNKSQYTSLRSMMDEFSKKANEMIVFKRN